MIATPRLLLAGLAALALLPRPAAAPAADPPEKLREVVVGAAFLDENRLRAAAQLSQARPDMLGDALVALGEKEKDARNLNFLAKYATQEEVRHLRVLAVWAAWQTSPEGVAAAFVERTTQEDEKVAARAVDAIGLVAPLGKDRSCYARLFEIVREGTPVVAIEAVRAINRTMDRRHLRDVLDAICTVSDNHVRKHLVWMVLDTEGERGAGKMLDSLKGRPGEAGKNGVEATEILKDKQSEAFAWNPQALKDVPDWWKKGRVAGGAVAVNIGDPETREKVQGWIEELKTTAPAWESLVTSTLHRIALRVQKEPEIFDAKKKVLLLDAGEIARCETPWQGAYVLSRDACIALSALLGEPSTGHRGWEPAYVDIHSFYRTTKRSAGKLGDFVDAAIAKKPWP